jgi:alcohol dehydrogenase
MTAFRALLVEKDANGCTRKVVTRTPGDLPDGDLLIDVHYSSLNYKDALSASGAPGVTRRYPHTPGIDAAGVVVESRVPAFAAGDEVIVIGFDLGMNTPGGFGQRIRVPAGWVVRRPAGLSLRESMILGTAGFTAALAVDKLLASGLDAARGPVLVTGATGGVGSVAVMLLARQGFEVVACTGKADQHAYLRALGAAGIESRESLREGAERPLLKPRFGGVVDTVGGDLLWIGVRALHYGCSAAACGLVNSASIPGATVLPFILRHVNLLGVDSVELPLEQKARIWGRLAGEWKPDRLESLVRPLSLSTLSAAVDEILAGRMFGRGLVDLRA